MTQDHGCKTKTIRKILKSKMDDWLSSIDDAELVMKLKDDLIVTGGSIVSMLMGDPINDFDVYLKTKESTIAVAEYYCKKFFEQNPKSAVVPQVRVENDGRVRIFTRSAGIVESEDADETDEYAQEESYSEGSNADAKYEAALLKAARRTSEEIEKGVDKPKYRPVFISENAISLSDSVQIVVRFYGEASDIHKNYDFEHCKNVWEYKGDKLTLNQVALECILSKTLIYTGSLYPICSLFRSRKFIERGWRIGAGEFLKMAWQISELNLKDMQVVRDQLTGCDAFYLRAFMNQMEKDIAEHVSRGESEDVYWNKFGASYVTDLVDKIFND